MAPISRTCRVLSLRRRTISSSSWSMALRWSERLMKLRMPNLALRIFGLRLFASQTVLGPHRRLSLGGFGFGCRRFGHRRTRFNLCTRGLGCHSCDFGNRLIAAVLNRELFRRGGRQSGINGQQRLGFLHNDATKLIGRRQVVQILDAEVFEEAGGRSVGDGTADDFSPANLLDQTAFQQSLHHAIDGDATNLFDLRASYGLAISDDGERFQRRLGEARRPASVPNQCLNPRRELRLADELPRTSDANEPKCPLCLLMLAG